MITIAIDTETTLFRKEAYGWNNKTRIQPFGGHELVVTSIAGPFGVRVVRRHETEDALIPLLQESPLIIMHNAAFDWWVLYNACPRLRELLIHAVSEGRVYDTQLAELLIQIAHGSTLAKDYVLRTPHLAGLAQKYLGITLEKGIERVTFAPYLDPSIEIPQKHLDYAGKDAEITLRVWQAQLDQLRYLESNFDGPQDCRLPAEYRAKCGFGPLGLSIQTRGAIAFYWLMQHPLRVDQQLAESRRLQLHEELVLLEEKLIAGGCASRGKKTKKFKLSQKTLRLWLENLVASQQLQEAPYSNTGLLSLDYRYWREQLQLITDNDPDFPNKDALNVWLRYSKIRRLLSTYLYPYASSPVHYPRYWTIGARTTRTSCTQPNIQNIPKHRDGIRDLFVARENQFLIEGDFKAAELAGLAQVYAILYGNSVLGDAINAGLDPHIEVARRMKGNGLPWPQETHRPLQDYFAACTSPPKADAGKQPDTATKTNIHSSKLIASGGGEPISPLNIGAGKYLQECSSVIPATIVAVLGRTTSFLELLGTTAKTWFERVVAEATPLTLADLEVHIGREAFLWIITNTCGSVTRVSAIERQAAKAISFGLPGGLGYRKFALYARRNYGVVLTELEAKNLRNKALQSDPQLARYLADDKDTGTAAHLELAAKNLGLTLKTLIAKLDAYRVPDEQEGPIWHLAAKRLRSWTFGDDTYPLPCFPGFDRKGDLFRASATTLSGSIRGRCRYTERHNFPFQASVADISKLALWNWCETWLRTETPGWWPAAFVHDSFLTECESVRIIDAQSALESAMIRALRVMLPDIPGAGVELTPPAQRWGKATNSEGKKI